MCSLNLEASGNTRLIHDFFLSSEAHTSNRVFQFKDSELRFSISLGSIENIDGLAEISSVVVSLKNNEGESFEVASLEKNIEDTTENFWSSRFTEVHFEATFGGEALTVASLNLECARDEGALLEELSFDVEGTRESQFNSLRNYLEAANYTDELNIRISDISFFAQDAFIREKAGDLFRYIRYELRGKRDDKRFSFFEDRHDYPDVAPYVVEILNKGSYCTGLAISPRFILSAGHCLDDERTRLNPRIRARVYRALGEYREFTVKARSYFYHSRVVDFALFESESPLEHYISFSESLNRGGNQVNGDTSFFVAGFPKRGPDIKLEDGQLMISPARDVGVESTTDFLKRVNLYHEYGFYARRLNEAYPASSSEMLTMTADVYDGNSGGPLFRKEGMEFFPVGVLTGSSPDQRLMGDKRLTHTRGHSYQQIARVLKLVDPEAAEHLGFELSSGRDGELFQYLKRNPDNYTKSVSGMLFHQNWRNVLLEDIEFYNFDFFGECVLENVRFKNANFVGVNFSQCEFRNVQFHKCVFSDDTVFPDAFVPDARSNLGPVSFSNAKPIVAIEEKDLSFMELPFQLSFLETRFSRVDFRGTLFDSPFVNWRQCEDCLFFGAGNRTPWRRAHPRVEESPLNFSLQNDVEFFEPQPHEHSLFRWETEEKSLIVESLQNVVARAPRFFEKLAAMKIVLKKARQIDERNLRQVHSSFLRFKNFNGEGRQYHDLYIYERGLDVDSSSIGAPLHIIQLTRELFSIAASRSSEFFGHFSNPLDSLSPELRSELGEGFEGAFVEYNRLKSQRRFSEALRYGYSYAKRWGFPSMESLKYAQDFHSFFRPLKTELLSYYLLDPNFSEYANPVLVQELEDLLD